MKVGIVSDSHDNIWNLGKVLERLRALQVEAVVHCGDYCAPFVLKDLDKLGVPVYGVFGNVDGDKFEMARLALSELKQVKLYGDVAELDLGGLKVLVNHYPAFAEGFAKSGKYDVVLYGHTHVVDRRRIGDTLIVNPGEVMGRKGKVTFGVLDTTTRDVEIHEL